MPTPSKLKAKILTNQTQDLNAQCKVVIYDWTTKALTLNNGVDSELTKTTALDVSSQILSASFTKSMGSPSGAFNFALSNSPNFGSGDWKDIIKPGFWCVIYMAQDGTLLAADKVGPPNSNAKKLEEAKKIRCIGFIDRVAVKAELNEKGAFDVVYEVSGRDFGVVYEDTSIWHNVFKYERIVLDAVATASLNVVSDVKINDVISLIHDLFFNPKSVPGTKVNDQSSLLSIALQWLMPRKMLQDIGFKTDRSPFWGELDVKRFSKTEANLAVSRPTDYLSGNAWEILKKLSIPQLHELFTETDDIGLPRLYFRPIPFAIDKTNYPTVGKNVQLYKDLPAVEVTSLNVVDFNVGEDNHARYNSFLATVATSLIGTEDNIAALQNTGFPRNIQDSIKRYGFRPMHVTIDSLIKNAEKRDGKSNSRILIEFNWLMYDYWNNAIFAESGEANIVGDNRIKVGKAVKFNESTPYVFGKRYYVEGYTDTFMVEDKGASTWAQSLVLTRGLEEKALQDKNSFGVRSTEFNREGEYTPSGSATGNKNKK